MCFGEEVPQHPSHLGFIDPNCCVEDIVKDAFENAQFLCEGYYLTAPPLKLRRINGNSQKILYDLLKIDVFFRSNESW